MKNINYFSETTLKLLQNAGWYDDRYFYLANNYIKVLEQNGFYVYDTIKEFLYKFGGLSITHHHAILKEKNDWFHFDVIKALNSGDPTWVSDEYSSNIGKDLCIIGEAFRRKYDIMHVI